MKRILMPLLGILPVLITSCQKESTSILPQVSVQQIKSVSKSSATIEIVGMGFWNEDGRKVTVCFPHPTSRCWQIVVTAPRHLDMVGTVTAEGTATGDFEMTSADGLPFPVTYFTADGPQTHNVMRFTQKAGTEYNSISYQ
jgi:hypothetical protein